MVSSSRSTRGGKSPRPLPDPVAPSPPVSPPKQRPAKKIAAAKKKPKKTKAKKNTTVVRLVISPDSPAKEDQRYYGGSRTSSTGLCGALKRQAMYAVKWAREVADIQAQIDDLPQGTSRHTETEWKLFDQLVDAKDKAAA